MASDYSVMDTPAAGDAANQVLLPMKWDHRIEADSLQRGSIDTS